MHPLRSRSLLWWLQMWSQASSVIVLVTNGSSKVADMVNDGETEAARKLKGAMLLQGVCSKKRNMLILSSPLKRSVLKGEHVNKGNVLTHRGTVKGVNSGNKAPKPTFDKWKYQAAHVKDSGIKQLSVIFRIYWNFIYKIFCFFRNQNNPLHLWKICWSFWL